MESEDLEKQDFDFFATLSDRIAEKIKEVYDSVSKEEIVTDNMTLRIKHPDWSDKKCAGNIVRTYVKKCTGAGITAASSSAIPFVGVPLSYESILPEELFILKNLFIMMLRISDIYGTPPDVIKYTSLLSLIGFDSCEKEQNSTSNSETNTFDDVVKREVRKVPTKMVTKVGDRLATKTVTSRLTPQLLERNAARKTFSFRLFFRGALKRVPVIGIAVGGSMNFFLARTVGKRTIRHFEGIC